MCREFALFLLLVSQTQGGEIRADYNPWSNMVNQTVHNLMWNRAAVIHTRDSVTVLENLQQTELMVYEINKNTTLGTMLQEIYGQMFPHVNVIVALDSSVLLRNVLDEADGLDVKMNHSTDWSHHSKWLVFSSDPAFVWQKGLTFQNLQNVAVVTHEHGNCADSVKMFSLVNDNGAYKFDPVPRTLSFHLGLFPNTKHGYNRRSLRFAIAEWPPFAISKHAESDDGIPYTGYSIELLRTIADHLNLTLKFVEPGDGIWGWVDDGMMGQLKRKEIDLVATDMALHTDRVQHVDFVFPVVYSDELLLLYKPPSRKEPIFLLTRPLQVSVYMTYLAAMFAVTVLFMLMQSFGGLTSPAKRKSAWFLCWDVIGSSLKQGDIFQNVSCSNVPCRILAVFWWMFVMIMSALYCGNLTASLASDSQLFSTIDEIANSQFGVGFVPGGLLEQLLQTSQNEEFKKISNIINAVKKADPGVMSTNLGYHIKRVKDGSYALFTYTILVNSLMNLDCSLAGLTLDYKIEEPAGFPVQKGSPFAQDMERVILQLRSAGIVAKLWAKWANTSKARKCPNKTKPVSISELIGAVIVTGSGIGVAFMLLVLECIVRWFRKTK